ncbi:MAG TPA: 50S ribosomal protein L17 [Eubacteriaceae bacterium]|nr:50S ribosomal protein L17 [Eubacteriaceae bacterium]
MAGYRKLGRPTNQRKAILRNQVTTLIENGKLETTLARAKETSRIAEKMITLAKKGDLHARRRALSYIRSEEVVAKLFSEIAEEYKERNGGYTRIYKLGQRRGDASEVALIELV